MHGRTCPAGREMRIAPHRHNGCIGYMHTSLPLGPNYGTSLRYYRRLSSSGPPESGPSCLSQRLGDTPGPWDPRLVQQVDTTAYSLQPQAGNKADILAFPHGASSDVRRMWKMQRIITTGDMNIPVTARHRACNQRCVQPAASNHLAVPERRPTAQGGRAGNTVSRHLCYPHASRAALSFPVLLYLDVAAHYYYLPSSSMQLSLFADARKL